MTWTVPLPVGWAFSGPTVPTEVPVSSTVAPVGTSRSAPTTELWMVMVWVDSWRRVRVSGQVSVPVTGAAQV